MKEVIFNKDYPNGKIVETEETVNTTVDDSAPDFNDVVKFISGLCDIKSLSGLRELGKKFINRGDDNV